MGKSSGKICLDQANRDGLCFFLVPRASFPAVGWFPEVRFASLFLPWRCLLAFARLSFHALAMVRHFCLKLPSLSLAALVLLAGFVLLAETEGL